MFAGWTGDLGGTAARQTVSVRNEFSATAQFNTVPIPLAVTGTNRLYAVAGSPAFDLTIYGTGFTPASKVTINGFTAASSRVIYVDANRIRVSVLASEYASAGEMLLRVVNTGGANCTVGAFVAIPVRPPGYTRPATTDVVEFYHASLDHYFITANPEEMAKLDNGTFKGWVRTGKTFKVFAADSIAIAIDVAKAVCRFYGNPAAGLDSHFYSAVKQECDETRRKFPDAWVFESSDVFQAITPDHTTGGCPDGTAPVYRLLNNRADVNHRYTADHGQFVLKARGPGAEFCVIRR